MLPGLHNVLVMLIEDLNLSRGIEFYRVEGKWGKEAEIVSMGKQWHSIPVLSDSNKVGPTNCFVACFIIQLIIEPSQVEHWCLGIGKGLLINKIWMLSFIVVPLSCGECKFYFSMRRIFILFFTLHEPKQGWMGWKWKLLQKLLLMTLQPEISSGVKVTDFKPVFAYVWTLSLLEISAPTPLRALAPQEVSLSIVLFIGKCTRRIKSKGLDCLSGVTDGKENLDYWSAQYSLNPFLIATWKSTTWVVPE